jgi:hypothetical protein
VNEPTGRLAAPFSVDCPCGRSVGVTGDQAGSSVRCDCGAEVAVPSLGRLRERAGKDRYESNTGDAIRRLVRAGELPAGSTCVLSGTPTDDVLELDILIPRLFKTERDRNEVIVLLVLGLFGGLLYSILNRSRIAEDGLTVVPAPLRVAARHHAKVVGMGQGRLRRLLRTVPIYAQLLDENPRARFSVAGRTR